MMLSNDYVAGLFDGEGWFEIARSPATKANRRKVPSFQARASLTIREREIVEALRERFGGTVSETKATATHAAYFRWSVFGEQASDFAIIIGPSLHVKQERAALVVAFQKLKREGRNRPASSARVEKLSAFYEALRVANRKGPTRGLFTASG